MDLIKKVFQHNWKYKLIALLLALCFWMWITNQSAPITLWGEQRVTVPLTLRGQPANLAVVSAVNPVSVRLTVDADAAADIDISDVYAYVDMENASEGESSYPVQIYAPAGVRASDLSPQYLVIKLDTVADKVVPVQANISGAPAKFYTAGTPILTPDVVSVRGPQSLLADLTGVTVAADLDGARDTVRLNRPVQFTGLQALPQTSIQAYPETVDILVPVYREEESLRTVPVTAALTGAPQAGLVVRAVSAVPSDIQLVGMKEVLDNIDAVHLRDLNVEGWNSTGTIEVTEAELELPADARAAAPVRIRVLVTIGDAAVRRNLTVRVDVRDVPAGFTAEPIGEIEVEVSGYPEWVSGLAPEDLSFWVDASAYSEGSQYVTPSRDLPPGVELTRLPSVNLVLRPLAPADDETPGDSTGEPPAGPENEAEAGEAAGGGETDGRERMTPNE
jgi:YbbR domain-containing protein